MSTITIGVDMSVEGTNLGKLQELVAGLEVDYLKALAGNKKAGTRVRNAVQGLEDLRKAIRTELLGLRKKED